MSGQWVFMLLSVQSFRVDKRRFVYSSVGIIIALSILSGSLIAVESSALGLGRSITQSVPVDFIEPSRLVGGGTLNESLVQPRLDAVKSVEYVVDCLPMWSIGGCRYYNDSGGTLPLYPPSNSMVFVRPEDSRILGFYGIEGELPAPGTVAISMEVANRLGLTVGSNITCSFSMLFIDGESLEAVQRWANISLQVSEIWTQELTVTGLNLPPRPSNQFTASGYSVAMKDLWNPIVLNSCDAESILDSLSVLGDNTGFDLHYLIWVDRERVVDYSDIPESLNRLAYVEHRLAALDQAFDGSLIIVTESELTAPLEELDEDLDSMQLLFVGCSVPIIALGGYISFVGAELAIESRLRNAGLFKARGASSKQISVMTAFESLLVGGVAGALGLCLGVLLAGLLNAEILSGTVVAESDILSGTAFMSIRIIAIAVSVGVLLAFLSSYRLLRLVRSVNVTGCVHGTPVFASRSGRTLLLESVGLMLAGWSIACVAFGAGWTSDVSGSWIEGSVSHTAVSLGLLSIPLMPFILTMSIVGITSRGGGRVWTRIAGIAKPVARETYSLIGKNNVRAPRRMPHLSAMVSFALGFGLLISITTESALNHEENLTQFEIGSDVSVTGLFGQPDELEPDALDGIVEIEGVDQAAVYEGVVLTVNTYSSGPEDVNAILIDSDDYLAALSPPCSRYVGAAREALLELKSNGSVLVSFEFAEENDVILEDTLEVKYRLPTPDEELSEDEWDFALRVVGIVNALPGVPESTLLMDRDTLRFISDENLRTGLFVVGAIVKSVNGADSYTIVEAVEGLFLDAGIDPSARILEDELAALKDDLYYGVLSFFLYVEYVLSLLMMSAGVGMLVLIVMKEREHEIACMMARGASKPQLSRLIMGESLVLLVVGLSIGVTTGLLSAVLLNQAFVNDATAVLPREVIVTGHTWFLVGLSAAVLFLSSLLGLSLLTRRRALMALRLRGG